MNADRLIALYEQVAEAPNAIASLRRFVLDLAVRGKLVAQDSTDEPARLKQDFKSADLPFGLPAIWRWMSVGDQLDLINGMAFKPTDWVSEGIRIVRIQNLNKLDAPFNFCQLETARERSLIDDGSFLISWSGTPGTSFGAFIWDRGPAVLNQHIFRCDFKTSLFDPQFLKLAINGRLDEMIARAHGGVGLQHITKGKLEAMLLPLPPFAEQRRIVEKVEELMALLDRLEAARTAREATRDRLTAASLARLTAPDADEPGAEPAKVGTGFPSGSATIKDSFPADARFALDTLPALTTRPDQIKPLRQTILNLAVRGKLVEQDPTDEPASEFLDKLHSKASKKKKTARALPAKHAAEMPFECPPGWAWAHVRQILVPDRDISYGVIKLGPEPKSGGVPTLRCSDVRPGFIDLAGVRKVQESIEADYARTRLEGGEVVVNIRGTLGGVALVPDDLKGHNVAREVAVIPISADLSGPFLVYLMLSPYFWDHIQSNLRGIAYKGLNLGILRELPIPLPPIAEQHRIVATVDALMALCDRLEAALTTADTTRARLLEALLADALNSASMQEMEAAE